MLRNFKYHRKVSVEIKLLLFLLFLLQFLMVSAQTSIRDSLQKEYRSLRASPGFEKDTVYINLLYEIGKSYGIYNLDSLQILAENTIALSKQIAYKKGEILGTINLGTYYSETGNHEKAIENFSKAMHQAEASKDYYLLLKSKNLLAIEYEYSEDFAQAFKVYLEGIEIAKPLSNKKLLSTFYANTASLYNELNEFEKAIDFLNLAKDNNQYFEDDEIKGITLANLASNYIEIDEIDTANEYVDQSLYFFEKLGKEYWLMFAYELKAQIFSKQDQPLKALEWYKKSERIHEFIDQNRYKIPLYNGMAKAYYDLEDFQKSEEYAQKALELAKSLNLLEGCDESLQILYQIKKNTDQPFVAISYLEELKELSDTLNKYRNEKELMVLKSNFEFEQEKERYILENEKKVNRQKGYFYAALILILSALVIIIILKRNNSIQNRLNHALTIKSKELKKKESFLENANNTKSRLFSIIAHDLKGPIDSFKTMFEMVQSKDMTSTDLIGFVPKMSENIKHVSFTLNNLLSWGQSQMDGIITKPEVIDIKSIVDQNVALLSKSANQKSIKIESEIDNQILTWSDSNQIGIVIRNLISNALKFTPENGRISLGVNDSNEFWEIWVKDTGVGLTESSLEKILNKRESFSTYGTNNEKGTGLGLLLCKEMVENNHGNIWAESTLGEGTCFYFTLPKAKQSLKKNS